MSTGNNAHFTKSILVAFSWFSLTDDDKIPGVFQLFLRVKNIFFQDPTPNSLLAKTKRYQVISATVAAAEIEFI